jgi:diadenosine tetraphosphate (Ap4A) HIT family hydrolase
MRPDKINLASLGNMTPHLHWHVIPRHAGDRHFPRPIWAEPLRAGTAIPADTWRTQLRAALLKHLNA